MYIIKNGRVHVGNGNVLEGYDILTEGRKIKEIAAEITNADAEIIDASGCEVFPGFIDPHSGIGAMGIPTRYLDNAELTSPITPEMNLKYSIDPDEVNAQEFYKSGITTIGCAPSHANVIGGQIAVCKTAPQPMKDRIVKEHAALKCSVSGEAKETYGSQKQAPMTRMGSFHLFQETLREARTTKEKSRKQEIICEVFDDGKMPVFTAASTKAEIDGFLHMMKEERGLKVIVDGFEFAESVREMKEQNTGLILGNVNSMSQIAKHHMDLSKIKELAENGNLIAFTNTCGGYSEGREVFIWTAIEVYRAGVEAEEIVKMMTSNPAKMLGAEDRIGTLEVGKDADISIYTAHPVTSYAARVKHSIVNGEVIL